jgi:hypothetical protein
LSEDGSASELERELLIAGQTQRLPEGERRALWAGIALSLPTPPLPLPAEPAEGHGLLASYFTKGAVFLAVVAGLGVGLGTWSTKSAAPPVASAAPSLVAAPKAPPPPTIDVARETEPEPASPATSAAVPRPHLTPASQLREESALVLAARAALRSGDAARCLSLLESARQRFPRPALGQEREALTIQALARSGQTQAAQRRAASFVRLYPESPYVADLRRLL